MVTREYAKTYPEEHLGRDILLGTDADLVINSKNDLMQVRYEQNITQAIIDRLKTQLEEDELHPNYGSRLFEIIGTVPDELTLSTARNHVREALLQEPRIAEIISIVPRWRDNTKTVIEVNIIVKPIRQLAELNLVYELFI